MSWTCHWLPPEQVNLLYETSPAHDELHVSLYTGVHLIESNAASWQTCFTGLTRVCRTIFVQL